MRVLVVGHVTLDRYGSELLPGGSAYYAAHAYRALGARVRVISAAGPDFPAAALAGIDAQVAASSRTTSFENSYAPGGARTQHVSAAAAPLDPRAAPPRSLQVDLLHLAPVLGEVDLRAWVSAVHAPFVGIGVQGWVRSVEPDGRVVPARWAPDPGELAGIDAAVLGEDELRGSADLVPRLVAAVPIVVVTHGERGCEIVASGGSASVAAYRTTEVDPTGAGDVFAAALFLALARGDEPVAAARLGAAAASIVVEGRAGEALARVGEAPARAAALG